MRGQIQVISSVTHDWRNTSVNGFTGSYPFSHFSGKHRSGNDSVNAQHCPAISCNLTQLPPMSIGPFMLSHNRRVIEKSKLWQSQWQILIPKYILCTWGFISQHKLKTHRKLTSTCCCFQWSSWIRVRHLSMCDL